jgi:Fibronectin type III domain
MKTTCLRALAIVTAGMLTLITLPINVQAAKAAPLVAPITITTAYTTGYTWWDNSPPGDAICCGFLHTSAGGTGTYADPITLAVGLTTQTQLDYAPGTIFYMPDVRRYFIVEDSCGSVGTGCHVPPSNGATIWVDRWIGGIADGAQADVVNCANFLTDDGGVLHTLIENPPSNLPVYPGSLYQNGSCTPVFGNGAPPPPTAPGPPTSVGAVAGEGQVSLTWTAPGSDGGAAINNYQVTPRISGVAQSPISIGSATAFTVTGLTDGTSYTFTVTASNPAGTGPPSAASNAAVPGRGAYKPLTPARILDTRFGLGASMRQVGPGGRVDLQITGQGGIPSSGVSAVVLNVTVTGTNADSWLAVWPAGIPRPLASSLNWTAGKTVTNLVEVAVGVGGRISLFNAQGSTDVIADVAGYVAAPQVSPGLDGLYNPIVPTRVLDTRDGTGSVPVTPDGPGQTINIKIAGTIVPSSAEAVVLNVAVTNPTAPSYLTVYPSGVAQPLASNLNFVAGQTVPNRVIVKVGTGGSAGWVSFFNSNGSTEVVADLGGWFTGGTESSPVGSLFVGVTPSRIVDTRYGTGGFSSPFGPAQTTAISVAGHGGVPAMNASIPPKAVVLNVAVTAGSAESYLTVWPSMTSQPLASDLNWVTGLTVPNLVVVKVGSDGKIDAFNLNGSVDVIVEVVGWYG